MPSLKIHDPRPVPEEQPVLFFDKAVGQVTDPGSQGTVPTLGGKRGRKRKNQANHSGVVLGLPVALL